MNLKFPIDGSFEDVFFVSDVVFILNIFISFNSGYYDHIRKIIVLERRNIAIHYLKTHFFIDLLSLLHQIHHLVRSFSFVSQHHNQFSWLSIFSCTKKLKQIQFRLLFRNARLKNASTTWLNYWYFSRSCKFHCFSDTWTTCFSERNGAAFLSNHFWCDCDSDSF